MTTYQHLLDLEEIILAAQLATGRHVGATAVLHRRVRCLKDKRKHRMNAHMWAALPDLSPGTIKKMREGELGHVLPKALMTVFDEAIKKYPSLFDRLVSRVYWTKAFEDYAAFENTMLPNAEATVLDMFRINLANTPFLCDVRALDAKIMPLEDELHHQNDELARMRTRFTELLKLQSKVSVLLEADVPEAVLRMLCGNRTTLRTVNAEREELDEAANKASHVERATMLRGQSDALLYQWLLCIPATVQEWGLPERV